jgi:hypothetical protein
MSEASILECSFEAAICRLFAPLVREPESRRLRAAHGSVFIGMIVGGFF